MGGFKQEVISIIKTIEPLGSMTIKERIKADGTVEGLRIIIPPGPEGSLKLRPYVMHKPDYPEDLVTYPDNTDRYISGDDLDLNIPVVMDVSYDDYFYLDIENESDSFSYPITVLVVIDYYGGKDRVIGGIING